jgi:hypothetical protein
VTAGRESCSPTHACSPTPRSWRASTLESEALAERVGALPMKKLDLVLLGIDIVVGR